MPRILLVFVAYLSFTQLCTAQKVLQIEKIGRAKTQKIYLGETIFIQTKQNPDWFEAVIEDVLPDAQALVFYDRIIPLEDITALRFRKKSAMHGIGRALQWSWVVPTTYQAIWDLANPPFEADEWKATGIIAAGSIALGSLLKLIPPKKLKFGEGRRRRLRVLDLTFYPSDVVTENGL